MIIIYSLDAPKSILETEKTLETLSSGQIYKKKKNPKEPTGLVFFLTRVFSNPASSWATVSSGQVLSTWGNTQRFSRSGPRWPQLAPTRTQANTMSLAQNKYLKGLSHEIDLKIFEKINGTRPT